MDLAGLSIRSDEVFITIHDGCVLEVFQDRRDKMTEVRTGLRARRRKSPEVIAHVVGTGRVWVAHGWLVLKAEDAAAWPRSKEMVIWHPDFDDLHVTSIRTDGLTRQDGFGPELLICKFHAVLLPTPSQAHRLKKLGVFKSAGAEATRVS